MTQRRSCEPSLSPPVSAALPMLTADMAFDTAARMVLGYLEVHLPMALWSVTRVENDRQTFLYVNEDNSYQRRQGTSQSWEDSFCIHMAAGRGPMVAPDAQAVPAYASAAVNRDVRIGAYAGAVINEPTGGLFGAICGIDPDNRAQDETLAQAGPLLALLGQLLTMVLAAERQRVAAHAAVGQAVMAAETDALTGLANRRAWDRLIAEEEERFRRFADPTVTVVMDLDLLKEVNDTRGHAKGDHYIRTAAAALLSVTRSGDVVSRLGGDEFAVLLHCTEIDAVDAVARLYDALAEHGVAGSIGWAPITLLKGFPAALAEADAAMYVAKAARRARRRADATSCEKVLNRRP